MEVVDHPPFNFSYGYCLEKYALTFEDWACRWICFEHLLQWKLLPCIKTNTSSPFMKLAKIEQNKQEMLSWLSKFKLKNENIVTAENLQKEEWYVL